MKPKNNNSPDNAKGSSILQKLLSYCHHRWISFTGLLSIKPPVQPAQVRWVAVLLASVACFQWARVIASEKLACSSPPKLPKWLRCDGYVQVGSREGPVVCRQSLPSDLLRAGLPRECLKGVSALSLRSGDRINWKIAPKNTPKGKRPRQSRRCRVVLRRMSPCLLNSMNIPLDINQATASELTSISGLGKKTARNIIAFRKKQGRFKDLYGLLEVPGIGKALLEQFRPRLVCGTVSPNGIDR